MKRLFTCLLLCLALLPPSALASDCPISRGSFLILLWRSWGGVPYDKTAHPFTDLLDDSKAQAAAWAYDRGLVKGVGNGLFAPDRPLTREECAALLRRNDALLGRDTFLPDGASSCNEYQDISPWADDSLYWACITDRMPWQDGQFAPLGLVGQKEAESYFDTL